MKRQWEQAFLVGLENTGSVTQAAEAAQVSRVTVYEYKRNDPAFAQLWEQALDAAALRSIKGSDVRSRSSK